MLDAITDINSRRKEACCSGQNARFSKIGGGGAGGGGTCFGVPTTRMTACSLFLVGGVGGGEAH